MSAATTREASAAPVRQRIAAHARLELLMLVRNSEQLLLTVVIPVGALLVLSLSDVIALSGESTAERVELAVPSVMALAILSTALTALAIQTGFERRYGVLRRIATTPLTRLDVLGAKAIAVGAVEVVQIAVIGAIGVTLGWRPDLPQVVQMLPLLVLGSISLATLALFLAGTIRAEATLAVANLAYLLLAGAGVLVPVSSLPDWLQPVASALPSTALAEGLRDLSSESSFGWGGLAVMVVWAVAGAIGVARHFHWE